MCKMASLAIFSVYTVGPLFGRKLTSGTVYRVQSTEYRVQSTEYRVQTSFLPLFCYFFPALQPSQQRNSMYIEKYYVKMRVNFGIPVNAQSFIPVFYVLPLYYYTVLFVIVHRYSQTVHHLLYCCEISSPFRFTEVSFSFKTKVEKPPSYKFEDQRLYFSLSVKRLDRILLIFKKQNITAFQSVKADARTEQCCSPNHFYR